MENANLSVLSSNVQPSPWKTIRKSCAALAISAVTLFSVGCGKSNTTLKIPGVKGPVLTLVEDQVVISVVFEELHLQGGITTAIPKFPNSFLEVGPDFQSDGTVLTITVSLDDVLYNRVNKLDPQTLPGGRPLPGVAGGALPAVAFTVDQLKNMSFYVGPKFFGVFVPIPGLNINGAIVTHRFYTGKVRAGNISLVGNDNAGKNGGFLLLLDLTPQAVSQMKSLTRRY
jgi:hypothetical protein